MSSYDARMKAIREAIATARALSVKAKKEAANMADLLEKVEQLARDAFAQAIQAEFGGAVAYIPTKRSAPLFGCGCEQASKVKVTPDTTQAPPSRQLVLRVEVHPSTTLVDAKCAIAEAVTHMRACGVHVRDIGVDMRGMGSALADALRSEPTIGASVSPIAGTGAKA